MSAPIQGTPFVNLPVAGDKVEFQSLYLSFKIPSDLNPYIEIYNWMIGLGRTTGWQDYKNMINLSNEKSPYSDAILTINSNLNIGNKRIHFHDCVPVSLGSIQLDIELTSDTILECESEFKFAYYTFENP